MSASASTSPSSSSSSSPHPAPLQPEASSSKQHYNPSLRDHPSTSISRYDQDNDGHSHAHADLPTRPLTLREPPAPDLLPTSRPTLTQFRQAEGPLTRAGKLKALWEALPTLPEYQEGPTATKRMQLPGQDTVTALSPERADRLRKLYLEELVKECNDRRPEARLWGGSDDWQPDTSKGVKWEDFRRFLWDKERELWDTFQDLDKNGDGRLDAVEMRAALSRSGIDITPATVEDLVRHLAHGSSHATPSKATLSQEDMYITFGEFRDFLIMLPRRATPFEIYKYYQVKTRYSDGRGAARVDKEGDINVSFPRAPGSTSTSTALFGSKADKEKDQDEADDDFGDTVDETAAQVDHHEAWRFLLAGGVAGAVSRTVTAPFDRLKIYLITTDNPHVNPVAVSGLRNPYQITSKAVGNLWGAVGRIYADGGGVKAFWVGNGLNVLKIFPESAIKFVSYEQSKRFLAKYWDCVSDVSELSSSSRFLAGGIGGITSQFAIYGLETLKTRVQSETGPAQGMKAVGRMARTMWATGGVRAYYRGLTLGLVGVFPYSAIDMGTYETLRRAYVKSTGCDEPGVMATLSFGALSGSIGAASVYPVNLLRTRLQAAGSSGHRHHYTGFVDVAQQTLRNEGWRGLYKGLLPSILKVGPAVGVSWIVYEDMKRRLGV